MKVSVAGRKAIKQHEGVRNTAYQDSVGVWTIGVGHTAARGDPIPKKGMVLTPAEVDEVLAKDLTYFEKKVSEVVKVPLNQNQFDALVSLCFNIGEEAFRRSTLVRRLNAKLYQEAADQFLVWNKAGGKVLNGLVNRRKKERALFLTPIGSTKPVEAPVTTPATVAPETKENWLVSLLRALRSLFK